MQILTTLIRGILYLRGKALQLAAAQAAAQIQSAAPRLHDAEVCALSAAADPEPHKPVALTGARFSSVAEAIWLR